MLHLVESNSAAVDSRFLNTLLNASKSGLPPRLYLIFNTFCAEIKFTVG